MKIREAVKEDLPIILEIMNDAILNSTAIYDYNARTPEYVNNWFVEKQSENKFDRWLDLIFMQLLL